MTYSRQMRAKGRDAEPFVFALQVRADEEVRALPWHEALERFRGEYDAAVGTAYAKRVAHREFYEWWLRGQVA